MGSRCTPVLCLASLHFFVACVILHQCIYFCAFQSTILFFLGYVIRHLNFARWSVSVISNLPCWSLRTTILISATGKCFNALLILHVSKPNLLASRLCVTLFYSALSTYCWPVIRLFVQLFLTPALSVYKFFSA